MRTTFDIDEKLIREVMKLSGAKTKKEALVISLEQFIKQAKRERFISMLGNFDIDLTPKDLERMREGW